MRITIIFPAREREAIRHGCSMDVAKTAFFMQLGVRKAYRQLYDQVRARA